MSRFLSLGTGIYTLAASVTQPIFEGGLLEGQLGFTKARYEELLWVYRKAVVAPFSNVEDALAATRRTAEQQAAEEIAVAQARKAYEVVQSQYRVGSADLLTVLDTETRCSRRTTSWRRTALPTCKRSSAYSMPSAAVGKTTSRPLRPRQRVSRRATIINRSVEASHEERGRGLARHRMRALSRHQRPVPLT